MKNFFYKLNNKYIAEFLDNIFSDYNSRNKKTDISFLQAIFRGINELFSKLGGRSVSKKDIPLPDDYPTSAKFNKLINDISFDIDKLYNSQKLIEEDVNSLLKFNSNQRISIAEDLSKTQYSVYSAYIRSKKDIKGGVEIPGSNPFLTSELGDGSADVSIDDRNILTLSSDSEISKPIDVNNVKVHIAGTTPRTYLKMYPNNSYLYPGSHWKQMANDPHSVNITNQSDVSNYKFMMIDDPNSNTGIGFCEFEAVITSPSRNETLTDVLKREIGYHFRKDKDLIYMDMQHSLQNLYIADKVLAADEFPYFEFKLIIPFVNTNLVTNEINIEFTPNAGRHMPKIDWEKSKIYSNSKGSSLAYSILGTNTELPNNGKYKGIISDHIIPSRAELVVKYDDFIWKRIPFMMSHYIYTDHRSFNLPSFSTNAPIKFVFEKVYDIFVDSEADLENEKKRALKVLSADIRS